MKKNRKVLVLDNYDSFTYNLVYLLREMELDTTVVRNDQIEIEAVNEFDKILLSPGPGLPDEAGIMKQLIREYGPEKSILGVCLGHQAIAEVYNATLFNMREVLHGVTSKTFFPDQNEILFKDIPQEIEVCHYHSWSVNPESVNGVLKVTAVNDAGLIMAIAHTKFDVKGVQFHPESILTQHGKQMMANWINN
ncbi:MAG: aminodeoxychorismate/anthranilate synthase component II [Cyclobacteriaceae bacterium]|jgi:anthranilate synthase component 2|nr:aminodeoxychorismate/anthranilate synthase component II [Cyclobacteriaceae bacterium]